MFLQVKMARSSNNFVASLLLLIFFAWTRSTRAQPLPPLVFLGSDPASELFPLGLCEGDCDEDSQCQSNFVCFQRNSNDPVPGCMGVDESLSDYCIDPSALANAMGSSSPTNAPIVTSVTMPLVFKGVNPPTDVLPLGLCEGDCDNDSECATDLVCHQRDSNDPIPGCYGADTSFWDYCVLDPNLVSQGNPSNSPTNEPTLAPNPATAANPTVPFPLLVDYGSSPPAERLPLGLCEGDCDNDDQCSGTLVCFQRNAFDPVPGCNGNNGSNSDYCVSPGTPGLLPSVPGAVPTMAPVSPPTMPPVQIPSGSPIVAVPLVDYGSSPPAERLPLGLCEGDCDNDDQCSGTLVCFQRNAFDPVPGCNGNNGSNSDYCVNPGTLGLPTSVPGAVPTMAPVSPPTMPPVQIPSGSPILAVLLVDYGANPPSGRFPLQLCEGDCDSDDQCASNLVCFQRYAYVPVPGCIGVDASNSDYCVDPNAIAVSPTSSPVDGGGGSIDYVPGMLTVRKEGLLLSQGLDARWLATTDQLVPYASGQQSSVPFHVRPDAGACFTDTRPDNPSGFVYVSNSEAREGGQGGVGAITFDAQGNVLNYRMLLTGTTTNCGGGRTPWGTWVSCEEKNDRSGRAFQVDPLGQRSSAVMSMGDEGGRWESFAYDSRNGVIRNFYMTEDHPRGALLRFTPSNPSTSDPWNMLTEPGTKTYLKLHPNGSFGWTSDRAAAMENARLYYQDSEGIDIRNSELLFVSKSLKRLYALDLDGQTWSSSSTVTGLFDGQPDQLQRLLNNSKDLLYFTEEGGVDAGIHARDENARFYTVMESPVYPGETTGLAISPDGRFMIVAYQDVGRVFLLWRTDGKAFGADHVDIKYHDSVSRRMF